jgi:hypothetical protein
VRRLGRTGRKDENHDDVVAGFESAGAETVSLAGVGFGCPDLLVSARDRQQRPYLFLVEIKRPEVKRKLRPSQVKFMARWLSPVFVVDSREQAIDLVKSMTGAE